MSGCPVKRMPKKSYTSRSFISAVFHKSLTVGSSGVSRSAVAVRSAICSPVAVDSMKYTAPRPSSPQSMPTMSRKKSIGLCGSFLSASAVWWNTSRGTLMTPAFPGHSSAPFIVFNTSSRFIRHLLPCWRRLLFPPLLSVACGLLLPGSVPPSSSAAAA